MIVVLMFAGQYKYHIRHDAVSRSFLHFLLIDTNLMIKKKKTFAI